MKIKLFFMALLCALALGDIKAQTIVLQVSESVELMSILSKIAGFPEYNMDLGGTYIDDINNYFASQENHPAVSHMQDLRRNYGISYDAVMSMAVHLQQQNGCWVLIEEDAATLEKRWQSVDKEQFLTLLNQFCRAADFHAFF